MCRLYNPTLGTNAMLSTHYGSTSRLYVLPIVFKQKTTLNELIKHVKVNKKWYKFGVLLNLLADELDAIEKLYQDRDVSIKALKIFFVWWNTSTNSSRKEILETLWKDAIGESAVADDYLKA